MWQRLQDIISSLFWTRAQDQVFEHMLTHYRKAKRYRARKIVAQHLLRDVIFVSLGIVSASFGLKALLLPNHFIDGGATGISLLLSTLSTTPLWIFIPLVNLPFILMGYRIMGSTFAIKTALAIAGLSLCLAYVHFPLVT